MMKMSQDREQCTEKPVMQPILKISEGPKREVAYLSLQLVIVERVNLYEPMPVDIIVLASP
jgi:hypothetical protein